MELWCADLSGPLSSSAAAVLTPDERNRAVRMAARPGQRFVASRIFLRCLLSHRLGLPPARVPLRLSPHGKPYLAAVAGETWDVSLSHAGDTLAVAIARDRAVGVDIEPNRPQPAMNDIADGFFTPVERRYLRSQPTDRQPTCFQLIWTAKEAYAKALGLGFALPFPSFSLTPGPGPATNRYSSWELHHPGHPTAPWSVVTAHRDQHSVITVASAPQGSTS
ncbi:4'-phosphopantetheinyl transferase family protein [Streptomyces flavofungini]|uniref:4'-phosphopantetheinyl transferase family protein n=1 Tax=Streptomyces flavofungini TaxID=68200 RepID=UPI00167DAA2D|nr:4'-phosphopantetheinyl transferase superfamily protein [Streptomyces flavofungini]GHC88057.1 hypothetical protein GCM10010349_75040 [Streptomyces flavofungini]